MQIVSSRDFFCTLKDIFDEYNVKSIVLHTDIRFLGILDNVKNIDELANSYLTILSDAMGEGTILFPTFNYDFPKTREYRILSDPCQVGALNEFTRKKFPFQRTKTPIFNFCILNNNNTFSFDISKNVFTKQSVFGQMVDNATWIAFFGASLDANTFVHHAEEMHNIGYRFTKIFRGNVIDTDNSVYPVDLEYRVRPLIEGAYDYDWRRMEEDLTKAGLLHTFNIGTGKMLMFRSDLVYEFWHKKIIENEHYFLTLGCQSFIKTLYQKYGYPFTYERMEGRTQ